MHVHMCVCTCVCVLAMVNLCINSKVLTLTHAKDTADISTESVREKLQDSESNRVISNCLSNPSELLYPTLKYINQQLCKYTITRSSATAEGSHDALSQLKSYQLMQKYKKILVYNKKAVLLQRCLHDAPPFFHNN